MCILNLNEKAPNTITDVKNVTHSHTRIHELPHLYEGWNFNSGNYLFTTDTK